MPTARPALRLACDHRRAVAGSDRELPVAVFDSGVGGLTVLHECLVSLPHEDFLYLGDTARFPYGDRVGGGAARVRARAGGHPARPRREADRGGVQLRHRRGAARAARGARGPGRRWWASSRPESRLAAAATENGRVGLIATPATVGSGAYARRARRGGARGRAARRAPRAELAPLIQEGGEVDHRVVGLRGGLCRPLKEAGVDTVILGCTHYPLVRRCSSGRWAAGCRSSRSGEAIADEVDAKLREAGVANDEDRRGHYRVPVPPATPRSSGGSGTRFLQLPIGEVEHVEVATGEAGRMSERRNDGRGAGRPAPDRDHPGFMRTATGSALIEAGGTRVICTASVGRGRAALDGRQGPRLGHGGVLDAAGVDRRAQEARRVQGPPGRPHRRDPAPDRPLAARRGGLRGARRAHGLDRLRRARGRRRHPLRRDHGRLRGARAGAAPA